MGTLFVVATPIGNLEDMTPRAVAVLGSVPLIAAEDTRRTGKLLQRFGIDTPMLSYHAHNERARRQRLLAALDVGDLALVSDAGTPGVSDPGMDLVAAAHAAGHRVSPIPGASSATAAVSASGLVDGPFTMLGFLPRETRPRRLALARVRAAGLPLVVFESATRLAATLGDLAEALGPRPAAVFREMTKLHEEVQLGTLGELRTWAHQAAPKGELVVVIGGTTNDAQVKAADDAAEVVAGLRRAGLSASEAAREAAVMTGLPRSELYQLSRRWSGRSTADDVVLE